jgi:hypothetical protein
MLIGACLSYTQATDHRFSSTLGFEFSYGKSWSQNLAGEFPLLTAADLDPRVRQNPEFRASACNQKIFFAKLGQTGSNLIVGAIPSDCMGQTPSMEAFKARTRRVLFSDYQTNALDEGDFRADSQSFWVVRDKGKARRDGQPTTVEYVATLLPRGIVYWRLEALNDAAISDFRHITVKLNDGAASELEPAGMQLATVAKPAPMANSGAMAVINQALQPDTNTPHHFDAGLAHF